MGIIHKSGVLWTDPSEGVSQPNAQGPPSEVYSGPNGSEVYSGQKRRPPPPKKKITANSGGPSHESEDPPRHTRGDSKKNGFENEAHRTSQEDPPHPLVVVLFIHSLPDQSLISCAWLMRRRAS